MTDQVCRNFCVNTATGRPFLYFGIQGGRNCYCGNTPPQTVAGLPNASLCTTPNSGDTTQAGGGPNAISVWLASPVPIQSLSGLPGGLPSGIPSVSLPGGLPLSSGLPNVSVPGVSLSGILPSGSLPVSIPGGLPSVTGIPSVGLPSVSLPITLPSGVISIPGGGLPSNLPGAGDLSSLLSVIGGIPSSLLPSGFSVPVSVPPTGLPGGVSSLLSVIGGIPSSALPSGLPGAISSVFGGMSSGLPGFSIPGGIPSVSVPLVSVTITTALTSTPVIAAPSTQGIPLPAVTPVADPSKLINTADPAGSFLGCLAATGLNGLPIFNGPAIFSVGITQPTCNAFCSSQPGGPYRFYAIEQGNLCHCGQNIDTTQVVADAAGCTMAAAGDPTQTQNGGGRGRLATFQNLVFPADPTTLASKRLGAPGYGDVTRIIDIDIGIDIHDTLTAAYDTNIRFPGMECRTRTREHCTTQLFTHLDNYLDTLHSLLPSKRQLTPLYEPRPIDQRCDVADDKDITWDGGAGYGDR